MCNTVSAEMVTTDTYETLLNAPKGFSVMRRSEKKKEGEKRSQVATRKWQIFCPPL
jgi:hypothetical protein